MRTIRYLNGVPMSNLEITLERLAQDFTVRDIMVPRSSLTTAPTTLEAQRLFEEHPEFDVIPIKRHDELLAFVERGSIKEIPISTKVLISDSTSLLDLIDVLATRQFCFVLAQAKVQGYVHYSDLNNGLVKLPLFVMLETLERRLVEEIRPEAKEEVLEAVLDPRRFDELRENMIALRANRAELDWVNLLSFDEIVRAAIHLEKVKVAKAERERLSNTRNLVCHADKPFVEKHEDIRRLASAKGTCLRILGGRTSDGGRPRADDCEGSEV